MDARRFDRLVRDRFAGISRRGVLGGVAAGLPFLLKPVAETEAKRKRKKKCKGGTRRCKGKCVNTRTDPAHCGACDNRCAAAEFCVNSRCALLCPDDQRCGSACCGADQSCVDDQCRTTCTGNNCPICQICNDGICVAAASGGVCGTQSETGGGMLHCCDGECPDRNCFPAGQPCPDVQTCSATCCTGGLDNVAGNFFCAPSGGQANVPCGSDADCDLLSSICQCGICCVPPDETPNKEDCADCCSGACDGAVCA